MNSTILEKVRFMLSTLGLSKKFWVEAAVTIVYLINRCPSSTINFKSPQELWLGTPFSYEHLRIFGCVEYAPINEGKLEPRALKYIFLDYPEGVKGYKLWIDKLGRKRYFLSRDVGFNESNMARPRKNTFEVKSS